MNKRFFILLLIGVNFGCDQLSKNIVRNKISSGEFIELIGGHLVLTRVENAGAFLSTGEYLDNSFKLIILALVPLLFVGFAISYLMQRKGLPGLLVSGMCFVIGGGLGNIYDRLLHGSVTDFLYLDTDVFKTGIFNLADLSVLVGLIAITAHLLKTRYQESRRSS